MKKLWWGLPPFLAGLVILSYFMIKPEVKQEGKEELPVSSSISMEVDTSKVLVPHAKKIGINIDLPAPASSNRTNSALIFVTRYDMNSFSGEKGDNFPDGMWNGAHWEIKTGVSAGSSGKVTQSVQNGAGGLPQYLSETGVPRLNRGDVIVLTKESSEPNDPLLISGETEETPSTIDPSDVISVQPSYIRAEYPEGSPSSFQEFLELCEQAHANPWIILPTTLTWDQISTFGKTLSEMAPRERFSEVIVELGNENWNTALRPKVFHWPYIEQYGSVADAAFEKIREQAGKDANLRFVVGGKETNPFLSFTYLDHVRNADTLATNALLTPPPSGNTPTEELLSTLFNFDEEPLNEHIHGLKKRGKTFAIYDLNATERGASENERVLQGRAAAAALAKKALAAMSLGADPIAVGSVRESHQSEKEFAALEEWESVMQGGESGIPYRPTGLAALMLNKAIDGKMYRIKPSGPPTEETGKLTAVAFKGKERWTAVVISENKEPLSLQIRFPDDGLSLPSSYLLLNSSSPFDTNGVGEKVKVMEKPMAIAGRTSTLTVPSWSMGVLVPEDPNRKTPPFKFVEESVNEEILSEVEEPEEKEEEAAPVEKPISKDMSVDELKEQVGRLKKKREELLRDFGSMIDTADTIHSVPL